MEKENLQKARFLKEFGAHVEKLIYRKFKTKGAFLSESGIYKSTLHDITKGRADPQLSTLWKIARELNVPIRDLLPPE